MHVLCWFWADLTKRNSEQLVYLHPTAFRANVTKRHSEPQIEFRFCCSRCCCCSLGLVYTARACYVFLVFFQMFFLIFRTVILLLFFWGGVFGVGSDGVGTAGPETASSRSHWTHLGTAGPQTASSRAQWALPDRKNARRYVRKNARRYAVRWPKWTIRLPLPYVLLPYASQ